MKKLLTFVVAALGLSSMAHASTTYYYPAVTELTDQGLYYIYNAHSGRPGMLYAKSENGGYKPTWTNTQTPEGIKTTVPGNDYVWVAVKNSDNTWSFKSITQNTWIAAKDKAADTGEGAGLLVDEANAGKLDVETTSTPTQFKIKTHGSTTSRWDSNGGAACEIQYWGGGGHPIEFYPAMADDEGGYARKHDLGLEVTYTVKQGDKVLGTSTEAVSGSSFYSTPELPSGFTLSEVINNQKLTTDKNITITVPNDVNPFKLVHARNSDRWAITNTVGLTTTASAFNDGEWLIEIPGDNGTFKIFSVNKLSYLGAIPNDAAPTPLVAPANANSFLLERNANGSEIIWNSDRSVGFNIRSNHVAGWSLTDTGSWWFMVYDSETFANNYASFYGEVTPSTISNNYQSPFETAVTEATTYYNSVHSISHEAVTALGEKLAEAAGLRFGKDDIAVYLTALRAAKTRVETEVNTHKIALAAAIDALDSHAGNNVNQYSGVEGVDLAAALAAAKTVFAKADATDDEYDSAAASIARTQWGTINMPVDGKLYRLMRPDTEVYASNKANGDNRLPMISHNGAESIWMWKDNKFVAWPTGMVIGNFHKDHNPANWNVAASDDDVAATSIVIEAGSVDFTYHIKVVGSGSDRYIYSANANVDCGQTPSGAGYNWQFEEVQNGTNWIPIALPSNVAAGYKFTLVSPVSLQNSYNRLSEIMVLDFVEGKVRKGDVISYIPANTPVLCTYSAGYESGKGSVFLQPGNGATYDSDLEWSYFAKTQTEDTHYMTWSTDKFARVANEGIIYGFAPYYEATDATEAATPAEIAKPLADPVEELSIESVKLEGAATGYEFHIKGVSKHDDDHDMTLRIHRVNGPQAPQRRTPAAVQPEDGTGDYVLKHADFETNENNDGVYAVLGTKLTAGTYEISTDGEGFFKVGNDTTVMPQLKAVQLSVYSDGTTSIDELSTINHQLSTVYDLQGRKLTAPAKGINIVGGKKILVK